MQNVNWSERLIDLLAGAQGVIGGIDGVYNTAGTMTTAERIFITPPQWVRVCFV